MSNEPGAVLFRYAEIDWDKPLESSAPGAAPPEEMVREAERLGARRKRLACGEGGFFLNRSVLPAGYAITPHSHDHDELLVVLSGSATVEGGAEDGTELRADDAIVIRARHHYGFRCGDEGMEFLTIRTAEASTDPTA
jgi:mannose-6-phosphate isomerase-like protein (cupin superfamily)